MASEFDERIDVRKERLSCYIITTNTIISVTCNLVTYGRIKHIEIYRHFIKEKRSCDILNIFNITSELQLANAFNKELGNKLFHSLICKKDMRGIYVPS